MLNTTIGSSIQRGIMLLEALIGLFLFSVGIIGFLGLQASALASLGESRYRAEAVLHAKDMMGIAHQYLNEHRMLKNKNISSTFPFEDLSLNWNCVGVGEGGCEQSNIPEVATWARQWNALGIPGHIAPEIRVILCTGAVGSIPTNGCPTPIAAPANQAYGALMEITLQWRPPNAESTRRSQTSIYLSRDQVDL